MYDKECLYGILVRSFRFSSNLVKQSRSDSLFQFLFPSFLMLSFVERMTGL